MVTGRVSSPWPDAILAPSGEHGSAKSTTTRLLRSLIDPAKAPPRKESRDDQTFAIMAHNNYVVALDNLSHVSTRLSDNMCTLATGAGDAYRKLYYNDEETLFENCRPQIFNDIEELATRGDLIDRACISNCCPLPPSSGKMKKPIGSALSTLNRASWGLCLTRFRWPCAICRRPPSSTYHVWPISPCECRLRSLR